MSRAGKIARRTLLIGAAAVAGGVAFGVYQARRTYPNPVLPGPGEATLNPWIVIGPDSVRVLVGRVEMGQGVHTTLAALVAEELDLDWEDVTVAQASVDRAYFNAGLSGVALDVDGFDRGAVARAFDFGGGLASKSMGIQATAASTSVRDGYEALRMAGATAREALRQAAAARWNLPLDQLRTEGGEVIGPAGLRLSYSELAADASALPVPEGITLRPASEWRLLGRSLPRADMPAKVTGTATFGIDVRLPDMLFATVRMCPHRGGTMADFDASRAEAMPGVRRVIALEDGIAVVASNTWLAMQAAEAVEVTWSLPVGPRGTDDMRAAIAESLNSRPDSTLREDGDVDGLARVEADRVIEAQYSAPFLAHLTMEPMNATARVQGDMAEIWCGCQTPGIARFHVARTLGIDRENVTLHLPYLGGGFGRRTEPDVAVLAARVAAAMPGTPVQVTWSREEDVRRDFYRPASAAHLRAVIRGGFAQSLEARVAAPSFTHQMARRLGTGLGGFAARQVPDKGLVDGLHNQPYAIPNFRVTGHVADLDVPVGFWRSVGYSSNTFFLESFIDEMALAARRDPLGFRLDMARRSWAPAAGVLEAVAEMSGWTGETPGDLGRGVAFCHSFGSAVAAVIEVRDQGGEIAIDRVWIACEVGRALDPGIIEQQMQGGLIFGLTAAAFEEVTFADGAAVEGNFNDFDAIRLHNSPRIAVRILETQDAIGGVGEIAVPVAAPALANAIFDLTGERLRSLPFNKRVPLRV